MCREPSRKLEKQGLGKCSGGYEGGAGLFWNRLGTRALYSELCGAPPPPRSTRLSIRQAQVDKLYASLKELAGERRERLQEHLRLCQLRRELDDLEQWIQEREVVAASHELGQDYEHVTVSAGRTPATDHILVVLLLGQNAMGQGGRNQALQVPSPWVLRNFI